MSPRFSGGSCYFLITFRNSASVFERSVTNGLLKYLHFHLNTSGRVHEMHQQKHSVVHFMHPASLLGRGMSIGYNGNRVITPPERPTSGDPGPAPPGQNRIAWRIKMVPRFLAATAALSLLLGAQQTVLPAESPAISSSDLPTMVSADRRWAATSSEHSPQFRRHVMPLFSKLGCNMRSCHGSFQGQNGFRLSLFGFEPHLDVKELLEADELSEREGPRANLSKPSDSLLLHKPTSEDDHEGGRRMGVGSWQYNLLRKWIEDGGKFDPENDSKLVRFQLLPREIAF